MKKNAVISMHVNHKAKSNLKENNGGYVILVSFVTGIIQ